MKLLKNFIPIMLDTFNPGGTIGAGQPVGYDGLIAGAGAVGILGICKEDVVVADESGTALVLGRCSVVGSAAFAAGTRVKVAADGKFAAIAGTDFADGKCVGTAATACAGNNSTFDLLVHVV